MDDAPVDSQKTMLDVGDDVAAVAPAVARAQRGGDDDAIALGDDDAIALGDDDEADGVIVALRAARAAD